MGGLDVFATSMPPCSESKRDTLGDKEKYNMV